MQKRTGDRVRCAIAALVLLAGVMCPLQAEVPKTSLSLGPLFSYGCGEVYEYVYTYNMNSGAKDKLSELDWDVNNVMSAGAEAEFSWGRFILNAGGSAAFPCECGFMQDYDWLLAGEPSYTEFSEHPARLLEKNLMDFQAGFKAVDTRHFSLVLGGGYQHFDVLTDSYDGYTQYSPDRNHPVAYDASRPKNQLSGQCISYELGIESLWFNVRADIQPVQAFRLTFEGGMSPWQYIDCNDMHYMKNAWYYDHPLSVCLSRAGVSTAISFGKNGSLVAGGHVMYLPMTLGNDYVNGYLQFASLGGAGYFGWDVSLSYRIRIF